MPYVIFNQPYNFDFRPAKAACREFKPHDKPQLVSAEIKTAAIKAGVAKEVHPPSRKHKTKV